MPLILGTNSIKDTGYKVANSLRFNEGSSDTLTRTPSSAGNRRTWTYSAWHKVEAYNSNKAGRFLVAQTDGSNLVDFAYGNNGEIYLGIYEGGVWKETVTNAYHRDVSAWYHLVVAVDTTQATDSNRVKLYVNGVHQTSLSTSNYPSQNYETSINNTVSHIIGSYTGNSIYYNGYMAEVVLIDGTALDPTSFGEFDSDSPNIWKPIDVSGLTFGTNGFYLDFENASSLGADVSGNSNNFTVSNLTSIDQSTDTCTNNFATMNPLANFRSGVGFSEGNLNIAMTNNKGGSTSTFGLTTGKWYMEMNITTMPQDERFHLGIAPFEIQEQDDPISTNNSAIALSGFNAVIYANSGSGSAVLDNFFGNNTTRFDSFTGIIGMALDMSSSTKTIAFSKAGAWVTGSGTTDTDFSNALKVDISTPLAIHDVWHIVCGSGNGSGTTGVYSMNFGSPAFSISSSNSDGEGFGNFEFAVPSDYFSINSKNLAEYG